MIVVDSNVWIALLEEADTQHGKAVELIGSLKDEVLVPEYVLLEVCTILKQKKKKVAADGFVKRILASSELHLVASGSAHLARVVEAFCQHKLPDLSFVDVSLLLLAKSHTVHTFDKKLARALKHPSEL